MEEVNDDNDEDQQEQSSLGLQEGENSSQDKPEICTQSNGKNGEKLCALTDNIRVELIKRASDPSQNKNGPFKP